MPSPEHEAIIASLKSQQSGHAASTIAAMRAGMAAMVGYFEGLEFPPDVKQEPVSAGGVPGFWFTPPLTPLSTSLSTSRGTRAKTAILYLHGGGYVMGSVATHRSLIARIARASGVRCLALDYRLAPEHPFPAGIEDACAELSLAPCRGHSGFGDRHRRRFGRRWPDPRHARRPA